LDAGGGRAGALVTARGRPARPSLRRVGGAVRLGRRRRRSALRVVVLRRGLVLGSSGGQRANERADEKRVHAGKLGTRPIPPLGRLAGRLQEGARLAALRSGGRLEQIGAGPRVPEPGAEVGVEG